MDHSLDCASTCGYAVGETSAPWHAILDQARLAARRAKQIAKGRALRFTDDIRYEAERHRLQIRIARSALRDDRVTVHYQPTVALASGAILGCEALVRLERSGVVLAPAAFAAALDHAETTRAIGSAVRAQAMKQMRLWLDAGFEFGSVAINASSIELLADDYADTLLAELDAAGLSSVRLTVEVTENVVIGRHAERISGLLQQLLDAGLAVALDDFGTGHASLVHLKSLPISKLKVDKAFIGDLGRDPVDDAIVTGIVGMGRARRLRVIAEGVETDDQVRFLRAAGCDVAQGHRFSPAVPADDYVASARQAQAAWNGMKWAA